MPRTACPVQFEVRRPAGKLALPQQPDEDHRHRAGGPEEHRLARRDPGGGLDQARHHHEKRDGRHHQKDAAHGLHESLRRPDRPPMPLAETRGG
jgi:hypothetical protein